MSLHDVDKTGDTRNAPTLNALDTMIPGSVKAHATDGIAYRDENNSDTSPRVIEKDDQIIVFDGSYNKALLGRDGEGNYVVKVAKDGYDVLTATDDQLFFNSAQNVFKIISSGQLTYAPPNSGSPSFNISAGQYSTSVAHGQSSKPAVIAFMKSNFMAGFTNVDTLIPFTYNNNTTSIIVNIYPTVDATNITFHFDFATGFGSSFNQVFTIRYYILQETATS